MGIDNQELIRLNPLRLEAAKEAYKKAPSELGLSDIAAYEHIIRYLKGNNDKSNSTRD